MNTKALCTNYQNVALAHTNMETTKCEYCDESATEEDGGTRVVAGDEIADLCESCADHYLN